jgi:hypothetical protein
MNKIKKKVTIPSTQKKGRDNKKGSSGKNRTNNRST